MNWSPDIVIYHNPCADGFGAAWAIHKRWPNAEYIPANYGAPPPAGLVGNRVLIVDFSYKHDVLVGIAAEAQSIVILDHHKSAQADLAPFAIPAPDAKAFAGMIDSHMPAGHDRDVVLAYFDMNKSGARLAWEFAHDTHDVPLLIRLIEDRDLWKFELAHSAPFALWLRTRPQTFEMWSRINDRLTDIANPEVLNEAAAMQVYHDSVVDGLVKQARLFHIAGWDVPAVNCPGVFASDVGNRILAAWPDVPFSATFSDNIDGTRSFSLRSEDSRIDVSEVATAFGGGGHRNAAGFALPGTLPTSALADIPQPAEPAPVWGWFAGEDGDSYTIGPDSRDGVIAQAIDDELGYRDGEGEAPDTVNFYIMEALPSAPIDLSKYFHGGHWIESLDDALYELGDPEGDPLTDAITSAQKTDLEARVRATIRAWQADNKIVLKPWAFADSRPAEFMTVPLPKVPTDG